jgi:MFS family permease
MVGTGWALVFPAAVSYLSDLVPDAERGAVIGSAIALMDVGQGFGGYAVGALADRSGFTAAYALPAVLAAAGLLVFALGRRHGPAPARPRDVTAPG